VVSDRPSDKTGEADATPQARDRSAGGGTGRQAAWNYLIFALSKSSTLLMTVVLARILTPADFGLFALGLLVLNLFDFLRDLGVTGALVQRDERWARLVPTGMTLSVAFGVLLGVAAVALAPLLASLLGYAELTPLVQVLAIGMVVTAAAAVPNALLRRQLDFRRRIVPEVAGTVVKTVVAIALAVAGTGVWSLVVGHVLGAVATTALYWCIARPSAHFGYDGEIAGSLLRFGIPLTTVGLVSFVVVSAPTAAIGRELGTEALGLYTLAYRLPELLVLNMCVVIGEVLFSALSRIQHDKHALAGTYVAAVAAVMAVAAPLGLGMAAVAPDIIVLLYGATYSSAADELAVLAVYVVVYAASFHSGDVYKAIGRPVILTYMTIGGLVVLLPAVWIAAQHSTIAVALTLLCLEFVHCAVRMMIVARVLRLPVRRQLPAYRPVVAALLMGGGTWAAGLVVPPWPSVVRLALLIPLGVVCYAMLLRLIAPATVDALIRAVHERRGGGLPTEVG
jgi:PST family polysaccharide transporter